MSPPSQTPTGFPAADSSSWTHRLHPDMADPRRQQRMGFTPEVGVSPRLRTIRGARGEGRCWPGPAPFSAGRRTPKNSAASRLRRLVRSNYKKSADTSPLPTIWLALRNSATAGSITSAKVESQANVNPFSGVGVRSTGSSASIKIPVSDESVSRFTPPELPPQQGPAKIKGRSPAGACRRPWFACLLPISMRVSDLIRTAPGRSRGDT